MQPPAVKSKFTVRKAALPRYHMHRGGGVCKCVGYDELQMCCLSSLLGYRHLLSKCMAAERRATQLMVGYTAVTHTHTHKHTKAQLESNIVKLLSFFLQHSVCKLWAVCKFSICIEYPGDTIFAKVHSTQLEHTLHGILYASVMYNWKLTLHFQKWTQSNISHKWIII